MSTLIVLMVEIWGGVKIGTHSFILLSFLRLFTMNSSLFIRVGRLRIKKKKTLKISENVGLDNFSGFLQVWQMQPGA